MSGSFRSLGGGERDNLVNFKFVKSMSVCYSMKQRTVLFSIKILSMFT